MLPRRLMLLIGFLYPPDLVISRLKQNGRRQQYLAKARQFSSDTILFDGCHPLRVPNDAKDSYEHFCWRDERMVVEIGNFLNLTRNRRCLYDVGALHGVFSFSFAAATGGRSFAFEPSPSAAQVLQSVQTLNPTLNVNLLPFALGKLPGDLMMRMEWQHFIAVSTSEASEDCRPVKMQNLDQFASSHPFPDCVKIDVEGYEYEVMLGAREVLKKHHPLLFLEIHPPLLIRNGTNTQELLNYIKELDYDIFDANLHPFDFQARKALKLNVFNVICK
jgi:FkbM family methyltransferase